MTITLDEREAMALLDALTFAKWWCQAPGSTGSHRLTAIENVQAVVWNQMDQQWPVNDGVPLPETSYRNPT